MGTNYYLHIDVCETCQKSEQVWHVGKASGGWKFGFHAQEQWNDDHEREDIDTFQKWKYLILSPANVLYDEYGRIADKEEFLADVESRQDQTSRGTSFMNRMYDSTQHRDNFVDPDGYDFSVRDFF